MSYVHIYTYLIEKNHTQLFVWVPLSLVRRKAPDPSVICGNGWRPILSEPWTFLLVLVCKLHMNDLTSCNWDKMAFTVQRIFSCNVIFLEWTLFHFHTNFTNFCFKISIDCRSALIKVMSWCQQAIVCTYYGLILWYRCICVLYDITLHYIVWYCILMYMCVWSGSEELTLLSLDKMAIISQTIFSDAFLWMKSLVFWLKFQWSLILRVQLTMTHHWFWQWLGTERATSHYLNQSWPDSLTHICGTRWWWVKSVLVIFHPVNQNINI